MTHVLVASVLQVPLYFLRVVFVVGVIPTSTYNFSRHLRSLHDDRWIFASEAGQLDIDLSLAYTRDVEINRDSEIGIDLRDSLLKSSLIYLVSQSPIHPLFRIYFVSITFSLRIQKGQLKIKNENY